MQTKPVLKAMIALLSLLALGSMKGYEPVAPVCQADGIAGGEFTSLTYNVKGLPRPLASNRASSLDQIATGLEALCGSPDRPDVVVLQELFAGAADDFIRRAGYRFVPRGPGDGDTFPASTSAGDAQFNEEASPFLGEGIGIYLDSGLVILSDYPIELIARSAFPQSACAGYDCMASKGVVLAEVSLGPDLPPVIIGNIHMNAKNSSGATPERQLTAYRRQVDWTARFVGEYWDGQSPFVFAGDFNMGSVEARRDYLCASPLGVGDDNDGLRLLAEQGPVPPGADEVIRHGADYQFFFSSRHWTLEATEVQIPFGVANANKQLSDHVGFMVRYRMTPTPPEAMKSAREDAIDAA